MNWRMIRTIIVLPGTALIFMSAVILLATAGTRFSAQVADPGLRNTLIEMTNQTRVVE